MLNVTFSVGSCKGIRNQNRTCLKQLRAPQIVEMYNAGDLPLRINHDKIYQHAWDLDLFAAKRQHMNINLAFSGYFCKSQEKNKIRTALSSTNYADV